MASLILDQLEMYGPAKCPQMDYAQAIAYNRRLARSHYENFTVVSWLLPARLRDDFRNIYAFCRWADDLGDETGDRQRSLELLGWWKHEVDLCYQGRPRHPVFVALHQTILKHEIPRQPFDDLIDAFVQDQQIVRYQSWEQLTDYCSRSANPVGRLVLYLCGHRDERRQSLSDATCTALQLANFWQDVRRDVLERDRVYLPESIAREHGLDIDQMVKIIRLDAEPALGDRVCCTGEDLPSAGMMAIGPAYRETIKACCQRTWPMFGQGRDLLPLLAPDVRLDIELFGAGGEAILRMIRRQGYDTLRHRPALGKGAKMALMFKAVRGKLRTTITRGREPIKAKPGDLGV
jgi:squalene synthase HpnC